MSTKYLHGNNIKPIISNLYVTSNAHIHCQCVEQLSKSITCLWICITQNYNWVQTNASQLKSQHITQAYINITATAQMIDVLVSYVELIGVV